MSSSSLAPCWSPLINCPGSKISAPFSPLPSFPTSILLSKSLSKAFTVATLLSALTGAAASPKVVNTAPAPRWPPSALLWLARAWTPAGGAGGSTTHFGGSTTHFASLCQVRAAHPNSNGSGNRSNRCSPDSAMIIHTPFAAAHAANKNGKDCNLQWHV